VLYLGCRISLVLCLPLFAATAVQAAQNDYATRELLDLSLEDLANLTISSVSKRPQKLSNAAASVFVITAEDIRRSGATRLPEALRLAPNLLVARVDSNRYAISARGFNTTTANKLQVLIDGRIAYTPLFSGVFWDVQDLLLEDVERIEVISGPGATTWGSNAVNGVINVITKPAAETQGTLLAAGAGNLEQGAALRHGSTAGADGHYRIYGKAFNVEETQLESGGGAGDEWHKGQVGFRVDKPLNGSLTVQGDAYDGREEQLTEDTGEIRGLNLLTRWEHPLSDRSQLQLQAYYDRTERDQPGTFAETLDILDLELQHNFQLGERQTLVWGLGHRVAWDDVTNSSALLAFLPAKKRLRWSNLFVQDEISLRPDLRLTLGARLEDNSYTGFEFMPNLRLAWNPTGQDLLWTSLARSVRTPSRIDRNFFVPVLPQVDGPLVGGPDFESETADSFELGYRGSRAERFNYSLTAFYQDYDDLRAIQGVGDGTFVIGNGIEGEVYGLEAWGELQASERWRLSAGALLREDDLDLKPGSEATTQGNDPSNQWLLRSSLDLGPRHELDLTLRHVGKLPDPQVPAYTTLDLRLGWKPRPNAELSLSAWNLLDPEHGEFGSAGSRSEIERSLYLELLLRY
jgi:iron complex outermembrane receptor protein